LTTSVTAATRLNGFHHLGDLAAAQVEALVARALELRAGAAPGDLTGRALGLLFLNPSLRTQASFQRAAQRLRMDLVSLQGDKLWSLETRNGAVMDGEAAEHVKEAAAVLGRYVDVLGVRSFAAFRSLEEDLADSLVNGFHRHAGVPVVNLESARWHPCQALADWVTLDRLRVPRRAKFVLTWAWHPKPLPQAVPNSTLCMAAQRGMEVVLLHPPGFELHDSVLAEACRLAAAAGGRLTVTHDRPTALAGAAVVYAKSYSSLRHWGDGAAESAFRADLRAWQVTPEWLAPGAKFMHCLPVRRNVVVADAVLDGPASVVLEQAENRLHSQTALLERILS
jgi:N-acetylornithine carbamoyltransferase